MLGRLAECVDRNSEVMQCAMETMEVLSRSSRTPVPDDGDYIIPDTKRSDKVQDSANIINTVNISAHIKVQVYKLLLTYCLI